MDNRFRCPRRHWPRRPSSRSIPPSMVIAAFRILTSVDCIFAAQSIVGAHIRELYKGARASSLRSVGHLFLQRQLTGLDASFNRNAKTSRTPLGWGGNIAPTDPEENTWPQDRCVRVISEVSRKAEAKGRNRPALTGPIRQSQSLGGCVRARPQGLAECSNRKARYRRHENSTDLESGRTHGAPFGCAFRTPRLLQRKIRRSTTRR